MLSLLRNNTRCLERVLVQFGGSQEAIKDKLDELPFRIIVRIIGYAYLSA